jgi:hypothetical protein
MITLYAGLAIIGLWRMMYHYYHAPIMTPDSIVECMLRNKRTVMVIRVQSAMAEVYAIALCQSVEYWQSIGIDEITINQTIESITKG